MLKEILFDTGFGAINVAEGPANGPTLLLLHGFTNRWQAFMPFIDQWIERYHLVAFDHSGHGKSFWRTEGYSANAFFEDARAVFNAFCGDKAFLVGHSMGGSMGLYLATAFPDKCLGVVTGDTSARLVRHIEIMNNRRNTKLFSIRRRMAEMSLDQMLRKGIDPLTAEELDQLDPRVMDRHAAGEVEAFFADTPELSLDEIHCPLLLTQANPAKGGILQDDEISEALLSNPGIRFQRFDLGHDLAMSLGSESPFFQAADHFLEDVRAGRFPAGRHANQ